MHHFYLLPLQEVFCWIPFKCLAYKKLWNATMLYLHVYWTGNRLGWFFIADCSVEPLQQIMVPNCLFKIESSLTWINFPKCLYWQLCIYLLRVKFKLCSLSRFSWFFVIILDCWFLSLLLICSTYVVKKARHIIKYIKKWNIKQLRFWCFV